MLHRAPGAGIEAGVGIAAAALAPAGDGHLHAAGATGRLSRMAAREIGRLLHPTGETERRYPGGPPGVSSTSPLDAAVVTPLIVPSAKVAEVLSALSGGSFVLPLKIPCR